MKIDTLVLGPLETNCYIVSINEKTIIIDPADEFEKITQFCKDLNVVGVLVTHHHFDHIGALEEIEKYYHLKHNPDTIEGFSFEVIKNPGHSRDSISFYFKDEKVLFAGDFIFYGSIGRFDFPESSKDDMQKSLAMIKKYPDDITIYPGHGPKTTLGEEKDTFDIYF